MDDSVLLSKKQERASTPTGTQERATACLLSSTQKQQIRRSQCTKSNVARDAVTASDQFIANATKWPFVQVNPQNPTFVHKFVHFVYKRSVDLGINRIIGGRPINPHQFKFVVSFVKFQHVFVSFCDIKPCLQVEIFNKPFNKCIIIGSTSNRGLSRTSKTILWRLCYR